MDAVQEADAFRKRVHGAQLQQLFNYLPGVYFVVKSRDGRVMMANEVAARLCGFEHEADMIGKTDYDIFAPDRASAYVQDDRHVFETGESIIDWVELAPDPKNSINWFVTTKIPLHSHDGKVIGLACIARNMTDAHEKLRPYVEMNEVLEFVRENHASPIRIEELAKIANLSSSQFERRFKKVFDITPTKHILNVRIRAACNLLSTTNETIASIALESGFYDHSHFIRNFRKVMGLSPKEYREQDRKSPW
ncbi:Melibiose operon regulatory protein [Pontiella sulfatireligans]|uniref:Melibiose operon regulatory protein n=2 Tax=Pontiella sulfatireligans TaxID=2750658 RepID=A0A6C2UK68_9BACT|nr:Melibiose operon regulatory protein [Pontiella sulfatireligans]